MIGLTTRQVRNLEVKGLPVRTDGNGKFYPMPEAFRWYLSFKEQEVRAETENTQYQEALTRRTLADARIMERKLAELDGALMPTAVHQQVIGRVLEQVKIRGRNAPGSWAERLLDISSMRKMVAELRVMIDEIFESLSSDAERIVANTRQQEIPEDFPEAATLRAAGIELFAELIDLEDLTSLPGIGPAKAKLIKGALREQGVVADGED